MKRVENPYPDDLITGYLAGNLSDEQQKELKAWLSEDEEHKKYFYEMNEVWISARAAAIPNPGYKEMAYTRFRKRVKQAGSSRKILIRWGSVAAAVVMGICFTGLGIYLGRGMSKVNLTYAPQTIEAPLGSKSKVTLNDGTLIWLNAGSEISYDKNFTKDKRRVFLKGQGYFEVTENKEQPFIVETTDADIEVLGTRFSVKNYGEDEEMEVILAEGLVNFMTKNNVDSSYIMKPGEQIIYNKAKGELTVNLVPVSQADIWTTGVHFFNELTFERIAQILEKSFDVVIIFKDESKKNMTFYGDFRSDNTLDEILELMMSNRKFKYSRENDVIEIY